MASIVQVGCGHWGKNLTRNWAELGVLSGIVDGSADTAAQFSEMYGVPALTFNAALSSPSVQGISLATPAETHAELAQRAINAGKHVYVEKPLALSVSDAKALIEAAEQKKTCLMVGHLLQYHPIFQSLQKRVHDGLIGEVQYVYSNRLSLGKFRVEENVLWSFAPHDISMILGLVGSEPTSVSAQGASFVTPGVADWCTVQFGFNGGARGHIQTSWLHPFKEQRLVVIGSEGMLVFEDSEPSWSKKLAYYRHKILSTSSVPVPEKSDCEYLDVEEGEPLRNECQHFVDCIVKGETSRTDGKEGLAVLRVLMEAEKALECSLEGASS